jgi:hypothetical protein
MSFYTRYVVTDERPIQLDDLEAALRIAHPDYAIEQGLLRLGSREIGLIDISVRGDPICDGDLELLVRQADNNNPRHAAIASQIEQARSLVCVQRLASMDDKAEDFLVPLWDWLLHHRSGVLASEGGGFVVGRGQAAPG